MNPPNPLNPPVHLRLIPPSPRSPVLPTSSPALTGPELDQEFPAPAMAGDTQLHKSGGEEEGSGGGSEAD